MARKKTIEEIEALSIEQLKAGHAVLFLGPAGVGKTETAQRIARALGLEDVYILNASQFSKEDLVIPSRADDGTTINVLTHPLDNKLILIDELTNANPGLMSALLSLVLEHRIGTRKFENMYIIATGNRDTDSVLAAPLPRPLMERFAVFDFPVPTVDEWVNHMLKERPEESHSYYLNFISNSANAGGIFHQEELEGEVSDYAQRPSPRSHSRVSRLLRMFYPTKDDIINNIDKVSEHIRALAGQDTASLFLGFIQDEKNHLTLDAFLAGQRPQNATQYMHLILDAATVLRPHGVDYNDAKQISKYADSVVEPLNKIIGAGLESSELRRLAALAPRYITGFTSSDMETTKTAIKFLRILLQKSQEKIGEDAPFLLLRKQRMREVSGHRNQMSVED